MNKLFVDTNAFHKMGYQFNEKGPIIAALLDNVKNGEYQYYNLSIIDSEIINHLNDNGKKEKDKIEKIKWLKKYLKEEEIDKNCYKDLQDYELFKKKIMAIDCNVSNINPEDVLKKYFRNEYPFEDNKKKKNEFPDAFISEYINRVKVENGDKIYFVTEDEGLKKSLSDNVLVYNDLPEFLSEINHIEPYKYKKLQKFILDNLDLIEEKLFNNISLEYNGLEAEEIRIESVKINNINDIKVFKNDGNKYYVNCKCDSLILCGRLLCLDFNESFRQTINEVSFDPVFIILDKLPINHYEFIIGVEEKNEEFLLYFLNKYNVKFNYEDMERADYENAIAYYNDYEPDFAQDGFY